MFKIIPKTNNLYEMSVEGQIHRIDGVECTLTILNNEPGIALVIYNKERTVSIEWLRLITHFEVDLKERDMFNIYFKDIFNWQYSNSVNKTMCFYGQRPEYKPGFRIIPEFTRYAISKDGIVIDTYSGDFIHLVYETNRYITVDIYDSDKSKNRNVLLHRLVALAWVKNPDHMKYYLVNHIDSNKHNPYYTNLEWTNHSGNNQHAQDNGLKQGIFCKVRNIHNGNIKEFTTLKQAAEYIGIVPSELTINIFRYPYRFYKNKYEIRLNGDSTEWNTSGSDNIKHFIVKEVESYNVATKEIRSHSNVIQTARDLNLGNKVVNYGLVKGETYITHGYAFRYKTDKKWNTHFNEVVNKPKCILAINKDGKEYECDSVRIAERLTKVNQKAISRNLEGIPINFDWYFKYK